MSFVLGYWLFVSTSAVVLVGISLYFGYCKKMSIMFWRKAKLFSAILGLIGVVVFLFNFDKSVHNEFYTGADDEGSNFGKQNLGLPSCPSGAKAHEDDGPIGQINKKIAYINGLMPPRKYKMPISRGV
jgi:hypothetical protein